MRFLDGWCSGRKGVRGLEVGSCDERVGILKRGSCFFCGSRRG